MLGCHLSPSIPPVKRKIDIVTPHGAAFCLAFWPPLPVWSRCRTHPRSRLWPSPRLCVSSLQGVPSAQADIELPATDKVRQVVLALIVQAVEQEILTVKAKSLGGYHEGDDFKVGELRHAPTSGNISEFICTISSEILADSKDFNEFCYEVALKLIGSSY